MFGKCLKYELRAYSRLLVPTFIAFMIGSVLMSVAVGVLTNLLSTSSNETVQAISYILLYFIVIVLELALYVIPIMVFVLTIRRFYTSFFTDEGYLTFTLPVSVDCHITSKLTAALISCIFGGITTVLTVVIIASGAAIVNADVFKALFADFDLNYMMEQMSMYGFDSVVTLVLTVVTIIFSILGNYLLLYLSISLGCMLAKKHRLIVCGACYIGVSAVVSAISIVIAIIIIMLVAISFTQPEQLGSVFNIIFAITSFFLTIEIVACYLITRYILKNKVNLD